MVDGSKYAKKIGKGAMVDQRCDLFFLLFSCLALIVLQGAARMVLTTGAHPAAIKDSVTTPGGCTIAGLLTMEDGKIRSTLARTIQEATTVASTLGRDKK
jgi:hypothetical protein